MSIKKLYNIEPKLSTAKINFYEFHQRFFVEGGDVFTQLDYETFYP
jgi:hypothetical protein